MASIFSDYTKEELVKKLKKQKILLIVQAIILVLMTIFAVFATLEFGVTFKTFMPLFFAPMLFVMLFEIKNIKKELLNKK